MKYFAPIFFLFFFQCKPKFDPNLEFTPVDVVYGAVSSDNAKNRFYIYTGFDANYVDKNGKVNDSSAINSADSVEVQLIEFDYNHEQVNNIFLKKHFDNSLKAKDFNFTYNEYYEVDSSQFSIIDGHYYKLRVENLRTEKVSYSEIQSLSEFDIDKVKKGDKVGALIGKRGYKNKRMKIESKWDKEFYSKVELHLIIQTRKVIQLGGDVIKTDTLYLSLKSDRHIGYNLPTEFVFTLDVKRLLDFIDDNLDKLYETPDHWRRFEKVYYHVENYSKEMSNYLLAEEGFNSLAQDKPIYTNIFDEDTDEEQLGLFYSHKTNEKCIFFDDSTMAYLDTSASYKHLGF